MSPERYDLVIKGGSVFTPSGLRDCDVAVSGGCIVGLGSFDGAAADAVLEAAGLTLLPGVIDTQVHFREPGLTHKEDLESGSRAAALGGVTAFFEMPNTTPSTLTAGDLAQKLRLAEGRTWTDHAFFIGAAQENVEQLAEVETLPGCCGVKVFMGSSTGSLLVDNDPLLRQVLNQGRRRVAVHAEDEARLRARLGYVRGGAEVAMHPVWRDEKTALSATRRLLKLARAARRRVHVLHISTAEELPLLAENRDIATVEVTPQHLTLAAPECYQRLGSLAQMNPPIREARHREALWAAIENGLVDVIGSDHAPHTAEEKSATYPATPSGMPGVQTLLPLLLDHMNAGRLSLARLVDLTSAGAQRIYNIAGKGRIALGYDADFSIVDLKARREITGDWLASKCGWSPFEGVTVTGWPVATIVRGHLVMRDGTLVGKKPIGRPVRFQETL